MPPRVTREKVEKAAKESGISVREYLTKLPDEYLAEAANQSNMDVLEYRGRLSDAWGEPTNGQKKTKEEEPIRTPAPPAADTAEPEQPSANGTSNGSPSKSQSGSPFGIQPLQGPTNKGEIAQAGFTTMPTPETTQAKAERENREMAQGIESMRINPEGDQRIDTKRPQSSIVYNAQAQLGPALADLAPQLAKAGIDLRDPKALSNYDNHPKIKKIVEDAYKTAMDASLEQTSTFTMPGAASTSISETDQTRALRAKKDLILANLNAINDVAIVAKNPNAPIETLGREKMKTVDPIGYANWQAAPDMVRPNYDMKMYGIEMKKRFLTIKAEQNTLTPDDVNEYKNLMKRQEDIPYENKDIRKGQLREYFQQKLGAEGKLGAVLGDDMPRLVIDEIDKAIKNPLNKRDIPLLNEMKDDLDFGAYFGAFERLRKLGTDEESKRFIAEESKYTGQGAGEAAGRALAGNFTETAKYFQIKFGDRTKADALREQDVEQTSGKMFVPKEFAFTRPDKILDVREGSPTKGTYIVNEEKGKYYGLNFAALPYKMAEGGGQFLGMIAEGEIVGVAAKGLMAAARLGTVAAVGAAETGNVIQKFGKATTRLDAIAGGIDKFAESKFAIEGITEGAEKKLLNQIKVAVPSYTMSYAGNQKEALNMYGASNEMADKVDSYAHWASVVEYVSETIFNPFEQLEGMKEAFKKTFKSDIGKRIASLSSKKLLDVGTREVMVKEATQAAWEGIKKGVVAVAGESAEEFGGQATKYMIAAAQGADMSKRNIWDESWNAFVESAASMSFLGLTGGIGGFRGHYSNNGMSKRSIYDMAIQSSTYKDEIHQAFKDGIITADERDDKIHMVNTAEIAGKDWRVASMFLKNPPKAKDQALKLGATYVQARTNELALQKQHDALPDGVNKNQAAAQIKKWQNVQQALLTLPVHFDSNGTPVIAGVTVPGLIEVRTPKPMGRTNHIIHPTVNHRGEEEGVTFIQNQETSQNVPAQQAAPTVGEIMERPVLINGKRGMVTREGMRAVFTPEDGSTGHYLEGPLEDTQTEKGILNNPIAEHGIELEKTDVGVNDAGNLTVRGGEYFNRYSDPLMAINRDEDGNIQSVDLESPDGNKRHFRGRVAEDLAYQITLKDQDHKRQVPVLSQMAAHRDNTNVKIGQLYSDNAQEPDAWVDPLKQAMEEQEEMAKGLTAKTGEQVTAPAAEEAQPVDEERAKAIRTMRNDDLVRLHFTDAEKEEYEKADDFDKAQMRTAKREMLLKIAPAVAEKESPLDKPVDEVTYDELINGLIDAREGPKKSMGQLMKEGAITYTDEQGNACAKKGLLVPGGGKGGSFGDWTIVRDLAGEPSHEYAGVDLNLRGNTVEAEGGELVMKNKKGSYAIIPESQRLEVMAMIADNCHGCLNKYISTLPRNPDVAEEGALIDEEGPKEEAPPVPAPVPAPTPVPTKTQIQLDLDKPLEGNQTSRQLVAGVAKEMGVDPNLLYSSAWQEGMNQKFSAPGERSPAYEEAVQNDRSFKDYPVDGFYNYGLDWFAGDFPNLVAKGYIDKSFKNKFKAFTGTNEQGAQVPTAAFKTNADALKAKAAVMKWNGDQIAERLKEKGIKADADTIDFLNMASYNSGVKGGAFKMIDELKAGVDITKDTQLKQTLANITPRVENQRLMRSAGEFDEARMQQAPQAAAAPPQQVQQLAIPPEQRIGALTQRISAANVSDQQKAMMLKGIEDLKQGNQKALSAKMLLAFAKAAGIANTAEDLIH